MAKEKTVKKKHKKPGRKKAHKLTLRPTRLDDYQDIKQIMDLVYPGDLGGGWKWI